MLNVLCIKGLLTFCEQENIFYIFIIVLLLFFVFLCCVYHILPFCRSEIDNWKMENTAINNYLSCK